MCCPVLAASKHVHVHACKRVRIFTANGLKVFREHESVSPMIGIQIDL